MNLRYFNLFCCVISVPPIIILPYEQISQDVGKDTLLQCIITSNPIADYYWQRDGQKLEEGPKYKLSIIDITRYQTMLGLGFTLEADDFGEYTCVAANSIGATNGTMNVYGKGLVPDGYGFASSNVV